MPALAALRDAGESVARGLVSDIRRPPVKRAPRWIPRNLIDFTDPAVMRDPFPALRQLPPHRPEPYRVGGVTIPEGSRVVAFYAGANRDPERFADPDVFDFERAGAGHVGFGTGTHNCTGATLSRVEITIALNMLFDRFARIEPAGDYTWTTTPPLSGPKTLPIAGIPAR